MMKITKVNVKAENLNILGNKTPDLAFLIKMQLEVGSVIESYALIIIHCYGPIPP